MAKILQTHQPNFETQTMSKTRTWEDSNLNLNLFMNLCQRVENSFEISMQRPATFPEILMPKPKTQWL